jgi:hypothetical protein
LGTGSFILIPIEDFPVAFFAFFWRVGLTVAFRLLVYVFDASALDPTEGSSMASPPGGRAEMGIAGIGMSPSKSGMGEIKLSRSYVRTVKT